MEDHYRQKNGQEVVVLLDPKTSESPLPDLSARMMVLQGRGQFHEGDCQTTTGYELETGVEKCWKPAEERAKVDLHLHTVPE